MTRYARQRTEVFDDLVDDFFDEYRAVYDVNEITLF